MASRLPTPGADDGTWGDVLNDFLQVSHDTDGTLKNLPVNIKDYDAIGDGATNDATAIQNAINDVNTAGGGAIFFPKGTYLINTSISLKSNVWMQGEGNNVTIIKAGTSGVSTAILLGSSGNQVSNFLLTDICLDGNFSGNAAALSGIQITNGSFARIHRSKFLNFGGAGVLLQGLNASGGTPDSEVLDCYMDGIGLSDASTGFGVLFKDASLRGLIQDNNMTNVKGGMGVGLSGSVGTGYPTDCRIVGNNITMVPSTIGFEGIGIQGDCIRCVIANNNVINSQDNGISASAHQTTVVGNTVLGALNHGIQMQGDDSICTGNVVRNAGQQNDALYGGISINNAGGVTVIGNSCVDDQGVPTMGYGIKVHTSGGRNLIVGNRLSGYTSAPFGDDLLSTDLVLDSTTNSDGLTISKLYAPILEVSNEIRNTGGTITFNGDSKFKSRLLVGNNQNSALGQLTMQSTLTTRATQINVSAPSQTSDLYQNRANDGTTILSGFNAGGTVYSNSPTGGIILKDSNNVYWRITINTSGTLVMANLGTTQPTT